MASASNPLGGPVSAGQFGQAGTALGSAITNGSAAKLAGTSIAAGADVAATVLAATGIGLPVAAAVAAIGNLLGPVISSFAGCGVTCTQATAIVNNAGAQMAAAFNAYMAQPVHYYSAQQLFISLFNQIMASIVRQCSNPNLATAGQRCITDNSPGACHWTASQGGWVQDASQSSGWRYVPWGPSGSGSACWNPYVGILDPVQNDPTVVADQINPVAAAASTGSLTSSNYSTIATSTGITGIPSQTIEIGLILAVTAIGLLILAELLKE